MANGNGLGAQGAAIYGGMNGAIMPSAGHYSDMQALMQNMEQLSGWLEQNRQDWSAVQDGLARVERLQVRWRLNDSSKHRSRRKRHHTKDHQSQDRTQTH